MSLQSRSIPKAGRRHIVPIALIAVVVLVAGVLVAGEAYARHKVSNCISSQFEKEMGSRIKVGFGPKPLLITWIDGKLSELTVDSDDADFGPAAGMRVHARFNDLDVSDSSTTGTTIGSSAAHVDWSNPGIAQTLKGLVSEVRSVPATGQLDMRVLGGIGTLQVVPQIRDGKVDVQVSSASLLGIGIPNDLAEGVVDLMTDSLQTYPMGLQPTEVRVTDSGLEVDLHGGPTRLPPAENSEATC
ncbi:LmeA family phospholipid-binding protein [Nocardia paucivorans]|uniref:LmeA family phospholipid-binding protein n=1 Tax=Nocardia paucivorans TaxID=114259 RepID=UPI0002F9ECD3|nr:DUF2993 domain-containing protein [Nocardia paucivorans]